LSNSEGGLSEDGLSEDAPAKLNLALHVRRRRDDGYHDLETVFAFTDFGDTLMARPGDRLTLDVVGPFAGAVGAGDNLVLRAARALAAAAVDGGAIGGGAALHLDKRIPVAAGLGGGSADAAAALRLLNRLWCLDWPLDRLLPIATDLGADVPACLYNRTMFGTGRGERLQAVIDEATAGLPVLLVNPGVAVPTGPVFEAWDRLDRGPLHPDLWRDGRNDLAMPAVRLQPVIAEVLDALSATGATLARMSGSGATCFAIYSDDAARDRALDEIAGRRRWWAVATAMRAASTE